MGYTALILHHEQHERAARVETAIHGHSETTWLDPDPVQCVPELPDELSGPAVALYLATREGRDDRQLQATVAAVLGAHVTVLPVVRGGDDFHAVVR